MVCSSLSFSGRRAGVEQTAGTEWLHDPQLRMTITRMAARRREARQLGGSCGLNVLGR